MKKAAIETETEELMQIERESCWMDEIIRYLQDGKLQEDKKEARRIIQRASRFRYDGQNLYKRSYTWPYLKCLHPIDATYSLREVHEGVCGKHLGGKALIQKIILRGLYWSTLRKDALYLVKKCDKCQKFAPTSDQPAVALAPIISPIPFSIWGMDILGPFPEAPGGRKFVVVAVDYFTKDPTGESPFNLTFGTEAVIPMEIGVPSFHIQHFNEWRNNEGLRTNLDLLDELREDSKLRLAAYQQKIARYYNSKLRPRDHRVGDLVLRKAAVSQPRKVGKLSPTWEGPYKVAQVIRPSNYLQETLEGHLLPHAWNSKNLKKYYQ
ncbi:uncharacterized protein LOC143855952 [Tasmannia lanceolata]|uniref:uncharacterized protein LOC143855952 n=1 Tax=Tasmannia lanceolata TaxID=3420 RepID=UPI004063CCDE